MKIEKFKPLDIQNISGDFNSQQANIDESSKGFIFEMLANIYSNPIGSICREITSNCFDSHLEAKVDKAVVISKVYEDETTYIVFKDVGVGLSPQRMSKIYMNYGSSTKRDDDSLIGGFGLGSKTPLSYADYFYIETVSNRKLVDLPVRNVPYVKFGKLEVILDKGIKYDYLFSKGEEFPTLELLNEEETEECNGTEIKIEIKDYADQVKFETALKEQLSYFDNVYFKGWNINNYYKIYDNDLYKFRSTDLYSDEMHICLGKVAYPIDWKKIDEERLNIPVGIKFEIGELIVTPSRENLRYTDEIKVLVKERVQKVKEALIQLYQEQNKVKTTFKDWYELKDTKPFIDFGDGNKLYLNGIKDIDKKHRFELFEDIEFYYNLDNPFGLFYEGVKQIEYGVDSRYCNTPDLTDRYVHDRGKFSIVTNSSTSTIKSKYFKSGWLLKRKDSREISHRFTFQKEFIKGVKIKELNDKRIYKFGTKAYFNLGFAVKAHKINKELRRIFQEWDNIVNYNEIPQDFIDNYNAERREHDLTLQRKLQGKVYIKPISEYRDYDWKISDIHGYTGIIVYGNRDDKDKLEKAEKFLMNFLHLKQEIEKKETYKSNKKSRYKELNSLNSKSAKVIQIAANNNKYFNKPNMVHVDNLYSDNKLFRKFASCLRIEKFFQNYLRYQSIDASDFVLEISKINDKVAKDLNLLLQYRNKNNSKDEDLSKDFKKQLLNIAEKGNYFDPVIESTLAEIEKWFSDIEILKFTDINEDSLPYILKYLREKGKKLNYDYYCQYVPEAKEQFKVLRDAQVIMLFPEEEIIQETKFNIITKTG